MAAGVSKMSSIRASAGGAPAAAGGAAPAQDEKKEEKVEEDAMEGGMNLFGDEDEY